MSDRPGPGLPESYRHLNNFAERFTAGSVVYEVGAVPDRFFVVLSGAVNLEAVDERGRRSLVGEAVVGDLIGHLAAFAGQPAKTNARTARDSVLIAVPVSEAVVAFVASPDLAIAVARDLAERVPAEVSAELPILGHSAELATSVQRAAATAVVEAPTLVVATTEPTVTLISQPAAEPIEPAPSVAPATGIGLSSIGDGWVQALTKLDIEFDETFFFKDTTGCPACGSRFEYLRVRTSGIRPQHRDSDFYVTYRSEDPTRYGLVVCPTCSFSALHDDFGSLSPEEQTAIVGASQARGRYDYPNLGGLRSVDESLIALELAQGCYALRKPSERRNAVLLHRRVWIERERGDEAAELEWLVQARDAYRRSFELDGEISEESAMRVAYLIGDLSLRLDDPLLGAKWLETATRFPEAKQQTGLVSAARDRLSDARKQLAELEAGEPQSA